MDSADIIVIGAGGAGLIAALAAASVGATVIVLEKGARLGGTAAVSGGVVWAPLNHHIDAAEPDSRAAALAYFNAVDQRSLRTDVLEAFVDHAAEAIRFIEDHSRVRFAVIPGYPDYFTDRDGARANGGRALDSGLFPFAELGDWRDKVLSAAIYPLTLAETPLGGGSGVIAPDVLRGRIAADQRGFGQALVGGLLEACLNAGVEIRLNAPASGIVRQGDRVVGVTVAKTMAAARRGVIVTTGGFEWNDELARTFLRGPIAYPASPPGNTGDGLRMLMTAGAALGNMTDAWWCPTIIAAETWEDGSPRATPALIERTLPGSLMVNAQGQRFCNEAVNYSALAGAFHQFDPDRYAYANLPAWLVFDHGYRLRASVAGVPPGADPPDWMVAAPTLPELAALAGIPPAALVATVARFNADAADGHDTAFHRGDSTYDRFYGDRSRDGALATLGALETPPFYAVPIHPGVLGTCGGAKTDPKGRVLDHDDTPIPGLYAAGNVIASPTGGIYAGAGGTLGPALTYGYLAGRTAAAANAGA